MPGFWTGFNKLFTKSVAMVFIRVPISLRRPLRFNLPQTSLCLLHEPTVVSNRPIVQIHGPIVIFFFFFAALLAWMEIWGWLDELWRESLQADTFGWGLLYKTGAAMKEIHHCPNGLLTLLWGSRNTWQPCPSTTLENNSIFPHQKI